MNNTTVEASIIIPSYKQKNVIFDALDSVINQKTDFPFEIFVVESSGDDTASLIRERYKNINVIELKDRAYPGTARNQAINMAKGKYLAFTDTDCIVDQYWLQNLVDAHKRGYNVVGGLVKNGTPSSIAGTVDYYLEFSEFVRHLESSNYSHFGTCNVSFKKRVFDQYGLFVDQIKGSDSLYCREIRKKGEQLYYQPKAVIWHRNRRDIKKIFKNQYELGYGAAINRCKYDLRGKIFAKYPILIPLLPPARLFLIGKRLLISRFWDFLKFVVLLPLLFCGLSVYAMGFYKGRKVAIKNNLQSRKKKKL